jgi:hypothetical protein
VQFDEPERRPDRFWPMVALIATIVATAGWTTVAVLALRGDPQPIASTVPSEIAEASEEPPIEESLPPPRHDAPALEALLPNAWEGTPLTIESWTGEIVLLDDSWSQVFRSFLDDQKKTPADLLVAQASDSTGAVEMSVGAFQVPGVSGKDMMSVIVDAWTAEYPDLETSTQTLGGKKITRGVFQEAGINSYWYEHEGVVFDVESADEALAASVLGKLP